MIPLFLLEKDDCLASWTTCYCKDDHCDGCCVFISFAPISRPIKTTYFQTPQHKACLKVTCGRSTLSASKKRSYDLEFDSLHFPKQSGKAQHFLKTCVGGHQLKEWSSESPNTAMQRKELHHCIQSHFHPQICLHTANKNIPTVQKENYLWAKLSKLQLSYSKAICTCLIGQNLPLRAIPEK